ncbi:hypothetical protein G3I59_08680 [Amycolatopsis rubida]|uniref:Uncharacterized protein n=1 Tax=Amycolatopsis rubida TaxID=112413 RepID=A0ABX0BK66_9PSEU|nr:MULTISPECIES: hypothetical protein [Amycolatopsis]MYW90685.1 hypothetical protein [Amycolatopsis rubida]NEC55666.1 hypothetical protein [Amycolatopsis rubida]OAP23739.1 hypothetical protein A4R44_05600 [Amycolatopsis sp. M39]
MGVKLNGADHVEKIRTLIPAFEDWLAKNGQVIHHNTRVAENIVTTDHDDASETSADLEPEWLARLLTLAPEFAEADRDLLAYWDEPPCRDPTWEPLDEDTALRRPNLLPRVRLSQRVVTIANTIVQTWDQFYEDIRPGPSTTSSTPSALRRRPATSRPASR